MKKIKLISICTLSYAALFGQTIERNVTAIAGDDFKNSDITLCWTIGECITDYFGQNSINLSQGFQQANLSIQTVAIDNTLKYEIQVYPNPAKDNLKVKIENTQSNLFVEFNDIQGRLIFKEKLIKNITDFEIDKLSAGSYLLNIKNSDGKINKTYKIVKY